MLNSCSTLPYYCTALASNNCGEDISGDMMTLDLVAGKP